MTSPSTPVPDLPGSSDDRGARADAAFRRYLRGGDPAAIADLFDLAAGDLHRTALHLVGDDATAHDLVQITFLAALEQRGFDTRRPVLPWLAGILRNQAALVHRRRSRALDRERLAAEPTEDPAAAAAARETEAEVEAALRQLGDVYGPVVRLHLLHGLDAGAIAASLQRPGGTVRTQLLRGLEKMRGLLPVGIAGLLAGLMPNVGRAAVRAAVLDAAATKGAAVLGRTASWARPRARWLALAGVAAVATTALLWRGGEVEAPIDVVPSASLPAAAAGDAAVGSAAPAALPAERRAAAPVAEAAFELRGVVTGTVRGVDGQPAAGAEVLLWGGTERPVMHERTFAPAPAATAVTAADGSFAIRGSGSVCYLLARSGAATSEPAISERAIRGELDGRERIDGLELVLRPLTRLRGQLVDPDGRGVADFAFGTHRGSGTSQLDRLPIVGFTRAELPFVDVHTDAAGEFEVLVAANYFYLWEVQHVDFPMLHVRHRAADGALRLQLERGVELGGVVHLPGGAPALGAKVVLHDSPLRRAVCGADGRFVLRGASLREGLWLHVDHPDMAIHCVPVPAASTAIAVRLEAGRALGGRVVDRAGAPIADAEVRIVGDRSIDTGVRYTEPSTWEYVVGRSEATTDVDGAFAFERLYDGVFAVEARLPGGVDFLPLTRARSGIGTLELRVDAARATALVGRLFDAVSRQPIERAKVVVTRRSAEAGTWVGRHFELPAPGGAFRLDGIAPGACRLTFESPGFALTEVAERDYGPGEHVIEVGLHPTRSLAVEVRTAGAAAACTLRAHLGDGVSLMLPIANGLRMGTIEVHDGKARIDGLPARLVTIVVERRGEEPVSQVVDLTMPPTGPLVFDLASVAVAPMLEFAVLVFTCDQGADTAAYAGVLDHALYRHLQQDPAVRPIRGSVRVTVESTAGKVLARGTLEPSTAPADAGPAATAFRYAASYADGTGQSSAAAPAPAFPVQARAQTLLLRVEADGMAPVQRRLDPAALAGERPAVAVFLRPQ